MGKATGATPWTTLIGFAETSNMPRGCCDSDTQSASASPLPLSAKPNTWVVYITNDNCPDYTWGWTEEETRQAFADLVRAHLDEMNRTDGESPENQDRYNMAATIEALCFVERYPERKQELLRRIRQGRVCVSPFLCNSLLAFQSFEGTLRTLYPARRLEQEWHIPVDVAEHIEEPSLPWGVATILTGCGVRWLCKPFYAYESTFKHLGNPPLFIYEGPDGSRLRVVLDPFASLKSAYTVGSSLLSRPGSITDEWLPHYQRLGPSYPLCVTLASGTHGDIAPEHVFEERGNSARHWSEAIQRANAAPGPRPKLINATLSQFCEVVDRAHQERPFLPVIRGCFGHSWDAWPVSLAKYAADVREYGRRFIAAEALLAVAARVDPGVHEATRAAREQAEWWWAMLGDHAWNGASEENKRHNAVLRRHWSEQFGAAVRGLTERGWSALGLAPDGSSVTLLNSLSQPRADLVRVELAERVEMLTDGRAEVRCQTIEEGGKEISYFVSPLIEGFGLRTLQVAAGGSGASQTSLRGTSTSLESPYYRLEVDPDTGGIASLIHKASGADLVCAGGGPWGRRPRLCELEYVSDCRHEVVEVESKLVGTGPVLARLQVSSRAKEVEVRNLVTVYADLDRVDLDLRLHKPPCCQQERLCQLFPLKPPTHDLRIETTGAVIVPFAQPEGDLLPGADPARFVVQGFADAATSAGVRTIIAPLDSFLLRLGLEPNPDVLAFECLGNDQNYAEVVRDQDGVTDFQFRYSLRAYQGGYDNALAAAWSQAVATPLLAAAGSLPAQSSGAGAPAVEAARAIATCLKPADGEGARGVILRLWEIAGRSGPVSIGVDGYRRVFRTDLLERDLEELSVHNGSVSFDLRAYGFAALRLQT